MTHNIDNTYRKSEETINPVKNKQPVEVQLKLPSPLIYRTIFHFLHATSAKVKEIKTNKH